MDNKKRISAIAAAINAHMESEATAAAGLPVISPSLWQASGRMEIMQNRSLWQRRIVPLKRSIKGA